MWLLPFTVFMGMLQLANAQSKSNRGKEFWVGYGHNVLFTADNPINAQNLTLYISTEQASTVIVSVNGTAWSQTLNIPANTVDFSIIIPKTGVNDARITKDGKMDRGIHIVASQPVVVYAHQYGIQSSAATMLFPVEAYGYSYTSINYTQVTNFGNAYSWMFVVAAEDNTRLQFKPSDSTQGGWLPGQTYTVDLNKGEIYNLFGKQTGNNTSKDLTGSQVASVEGADGKCHPFGMFSGSSRITMCAGNGGEVMMQQIFPRSAWGTVYLTHSTLNNLTGNINLPFTNIYRVVVNDPSTIVRRNGVALTGLNPKNFYEFTGTIGEYIEADKPILVTQYMHSSNECVGTANPPRGDPEMFILSPIQQGIKSVIFYNTRNQNITLSYVDLIVHKNGVSSLLIDGTAVPAASMKPHPGNPEYFFAVRRLTGAAKQHTIVSDSPFVAKVYGLGDFESYGYMAGTLINNLNAVPNITNVLKSVQVADTFTCPKSPFIFQARLAYRATSITWNLSKHAPNINGTDTTITNPQPIDSVVEMGRKYFIYALLRPYLFRDTGRFIFDVSAISPEIDHCDKTEYFTHEVVVKKGQEIAIGLNYSGCLSDSAIFTANVQPGIFTIDRYRWKFDDGTSDTVRTSIKKRLHTGINEVFLTTISTNGCVVDTSKLVAPSLEPKAGFKLSAPILCLGDSLLITDNATVAVGSGTISSRFYNFGETAQVLSRNNSQPFYHKYTTAGTYKIWQVVASNIGCFSDTVSQTVQVVAKPVATYTMSGIACDGASITFTPQLASGTTGITAYNWNLGNGQNVTNATAVPVVVRYNYPSSPVVVTLTVASGVGCTSDPFSLPAFAVLPKPKANIAISADTLCNNYPILMNGNGTISTGAIAGYKWLVNADSIGNKPQIKYSFPQAGNYPVRFIAISDAGCADTALLLVNINATPVVDAGPPILVPAGASGIFRGVHSNPGVGTYTYLWSPATALNDPSLLQPTVTPLIEQIYLLTVKSLTGNCVGSDTTRVIILKEIKIPNAFSPNDDGINDRWQIFGLSSYINAEVKVFDRYGRIVYQSNGYNNPWDATRNGSPIPAGVYYYIIDKGDKSAVISGSVMVIR